MVPLIRLSFYFRLLSSHPRLIQRYDTMQECIPFLFASKNAPPLFLTLQMHPSRLISRPFLDFSQTVRDPTRCDFAQVQVFFENVQDRHMGQAQVFFENVQDRRMGQSGLTGQLPNCPPSVSNNVATELTWASVALGRPGRG